MLDGQGRPLEAYTQAEIQEGARALTGWNYAPAAGQPNQGNNNPLNPFAPMITNAANHDTGSKTLLTYPSQQSTNVPANQTVEQDLDSVINNVFNHPNVGPFIGRQLIQHLVTSNPSPAYVGRVTAVFNNNGQGVRGDLRAVVRAILLDPEARGNSKVIRSTANCASPLSSSPTSSAASAARGECGVFRRGAAGWGRTSSPRRRSSTTTSRISAWWSTGNPSSPHSPVATTWIIDRLNTLNDFLFSPPIQPGGDPNPTEHPRLRWS